MIALLGRGAVLLALFFAAAGAASGWLGSDRPRARRWARRMAGLFAASMTLAVGLLWAALVGHDFSVSYVAQVGSRSSPVWVSVVSLWSSLEGSVLFWGFILALFAGALALSRRGDDSPESSTALAVVLAAGAGFAFLCAAPASPFRDVLPVPPDGPGPNPLLQNHPLMAIHPPLLYLGYVGMAVPFGLAIAALRAGRLEGELLASLRRWLLVVWLFLTAGIALGARWAYDVLGWGGYWAWDPVENASLLPWLTATAALHALRVVERRGTLKAWALALVQASFALTLLGTFLTRSGVVSSVHAFGPSAIGPSLLVLVGLSLVLSVVTLAARAGALEAEDRPGQGLGREVGLAANNLVLSLLTFAVLLGTLYPVLIRALKSTQVSVGEPYFNGAAVPLGIVLLFLMGVGPALPWGGLEARRALRLLAPRLGGGLGVLGLGLALGARGPWLLGALAMGGFAMTVALEGLLRPFARALRRGDWRAMAVPLFEGRRLLGAHLAHVGAALLIVAIGVSSASRRTVEVTLRPGEAAPVGRYLVGFRGAERLVEPNRESFVAHFEIERDGASLGTLRPRMNRYLSTGEALPAPAVRSSPREDLYLTLVSVDPSKGEVGLRAQVTPMVAWIWIGVALAALGGLVAAIPARRRAALAARAPAPAPAGGVEVRA